MDYFNLANERQSSSLRSRKAALALIVIGAFACVGALMFLNGSASQKEFIVNLAYNEKEKNQVISSTRQMNICTDQFDNNMQAFRNICTIYTTTQNVVVTRLSKDVLNVYVVYKSINENKVDSKNPSQKMETVDDMINDSKNGYEAFVDEQDITFKATLSTKGVLLSLESPNGTQPDTLVRLTERLVQQTFPEIDPKLYTSPFMLRKSANRRVRLLGSEESINLPVQDTYLGEVSAEYTYNIDSTGQTILNKEYTEDDFVTYEYNLGGDLPDIKYTSQTIVDNLGYVASNAESMHFNITENDPNDEWDELIGSVFVKIDSFMEVHSVEESDEELFEIIRKYEEANAFHMVDLESDGGFMADFSKESEAVAQEHIGADIPLLGATAEFAYTKDVSVFKKSVFSQTIELKIIQNNYEIYSDVDAGVFLNDKKLLNLYSVRINHPWLACNQLKDSPGQNFDKEYTIFEVQFPILGIITIPVRAKIRASLGWSFTMTPASEMCNLLFQAYAKPAIVAEGGLSIIKIAEGGVSFSGSVANGYFNFGLNVNRKMFSAVLDINAQFIPFEYSIDAYYRYFRCDFKEIFNRNLFLKKIIKTVTNVVKAVVNVATKIVQICGLSDPHYLNISKGQLGQTYTLAIFKQGYLFKNRS